SDTYAFPGTISGNGTVAFLGGGTVLFGTAGAYAGPILAQDATVTLQPGSASASMFTVASQSVLNGAGTIGGLIVNGGMVA
ncbi:hypothetical protein J8J17_25930, partial [Mycobacterium tuberculosis]|nr:hypothetical protein [Mycobacterium tuberculosis]